jgi:stage IV sporulation protein FB
MAVREDMKVSYIQIFVFGAVVAIQPSGLYDKDLKVILAGPIGSIFLAMLGFIGTFISPSIIIIFLFIVNMYIAIFNLLPLFPLDGGRILYYILTKFTSISKAINITVGISYGLCLLGIAISVVYKNIWLVVLLIFLMVFTHYQRKDLVEYLVREKL